MKSQKPITIFTDGASRGNPGPGGWGAVITLPQEGKIVELGGHDERTTNNRMEVQAAINAILHIKHLPDDVIIYTDSSYLLQGITEWVKDWIKNGWTTSTNEAVQNRDLWEVLAGVLFEREENKDYGSVSWKKVSGHAKVPGNDRADVIATKYADKKDIELYNGPATDYKHDLEKIEAHAETKATKDSKRSRSNKKAYSYISKVDGKIETHKTWAECEVRVKGKSGAKFKKAISKEEEEEIKQEWSS